MLTLATKTKLKPGDVVKKAVDFFGPKGYKLKVTGQSADSAAFEGGGGGVGVTASIEGKQTSVELTSREWDYQVKEFLGKLH
jgi:hypothetical protein